MLLALAGLVLMMMVFVAGIVVGGHPRATGLTDLPPVLRDTVLGANADPTASEVLTLLEDGYYRDVDGTTLARASVDGMLKSLDDPYTYYMDASEYALMQKHLDSTLTGIGISVGQRPRGVTILEVYAGGPAQKGGIRRGDVITTVDGKAVTKLDKVVEGIRGQEGTQVRVGIRRKGEPDKVYTFTRAQVRIPLVRSRVIQSGGTKIGYLRLSEFDRRAGAEVRDAVGNLDGKGVKAIVFDLRGDPGGLVDEAVGVVSAFVPKGSPVVTTQGRERGKVTLRTDDAPRTSRPVVVLVDRNSASASEIVAGALRDDDKATLVGTRTFGKALVQTTRPLRNGGALRFTTARYLTPSGFDLATRGLPPDVAAVDNAKTPADEALDKAVAVAVSKSR